MTKEYYKWTFEEDFHVPEGVYETFQEAAEKLGVQKEQEWNELFEKYEATHADLAKQLKDAIDRKLPEGFEKSLPTYEAGTSHATRSASGDAINAIAKQFLHFSVEVRTLQVRTRRQLKDAGDFLPPIIPDVIYGSVYVNLQWVQH